jgi:hypothetical protein
MSRGNRREWAPVPRSLVSDEKYLSMPAVARELLVRLYLVADSEGRFGAGKMTLRASTATFRGTTGALRRLIDAGYVATYETPSGTIGEIIGWHENITSRMRSTFGKPEWPARDGSYPPTKRVSDSPTKGATKPPADSPTSCTRRESVRGRRRDPPMSDPRPDSEPSRARGDADTYPEPGPSVWPPCPDGGPECPGCKTCQSIADALQHPPAPKPPSLGTHSDGSDRVYPDIGPAAIRWLEHRTAISKRHGYAFATVAEAEDINGAQLLRMQQKPGFDDCVSKMLALAWCTTGSSRRPRGTGGHRTDKHTSSARR